MSERSTEAVRDDLAVRFVTGRELAAIENDDVLEPADLWTREVVA